MKNFGDVNRKMNEVYDDAFANGKDRFGRVLGSDAHRQYMRFSEIVEFIPGIADTKLSILDVGCGNGEFYEYLNFRGFHGRYVGIDINEKLVNEANERFPESRFPGTSFKVGEIFASDVGTHDFVVCSGLFNIDVGQTTEFHEAIVEAMFKAAKNAAIFNAVTTFTSFKAESMYYIDVRDLINFVVTSVSPRFQLRHHFLPYNYTMAIYQPSGWLSISQR